MKFYDCSTAPSPRRVRIFLAEKALAVPTQQVDLRGGEHLQPAFLAINPDGTVPALALDSGQILTDAVAICHYFEEMHPSPPLIGATPEERALTIACTRRVERDGFHAAMEAFRNAAPGLKGRAIPGPDDYTQIPELAERGRLRVGRFYHRMNSQLAERMFISGERYTIADITTQVTIELGKRAKLSIPEDCVHLARWFALVSGRPSATA